MKRIRLMQDFRQCCQSLAKIERRFYTDDDHGLEPSPVRPGDRVHEPAKVFLDKINELRDQRVNQTAHMVLAEALGLERVASVSLRSGKNRAPAGFRRFHVGGHGTLASQPQPAAAMACS